MARFVGTFGATAIGALLAFLSQLVAARLLGPDEFGAYAYALSWITLLSVLGSLGLPSAMLRFVPASLARGATGEAAATIRFADRLIVPLALLCAAASTLVWIVAPGSSARHGALALALLAVPFAVMVKLRAAALRTYDMTTRSVLVETPIREAISLMAFIAILAAGLSIAATGAIAVTSLAIVASAAISTAWLARYQRRVDIPELPRETSVHILRTALGLLAVSGGHLALKRLDVILVASLVGVREAGLYAIALRMGDVLQLPLTAATVLMAPRISHAYSLNDRIGLQENAALTSLYSMVLCVTAALPLIVAPEFFLGLFGPEFTVAAPLVRLLAVAQIVAASAGTVNILLTMTGNERVVLRVVAALGAFHLGMSAALLLTLGVIGGAVANLVSTVALNLTLSLIVNRKLKLRPGWLHFVLPRRNVMPR